MRLTCPNCGAQYEVPDDIIPEAGRDVQCSNCGNTWFQVHPDAQTEAVTEAVEEETLAAESTDEAAVEDVFEEVEPPELSIDGGDEHDAAIEDVEDEFSEDDENLEEMDLDGADWDIETDADWATPLDEDDVPEEDTAAEPEIDEPETEQEPIAASEPAPFEDEYEDDQEDMAATIAAAAAAAAPAGRGLDDSVKDILREEAEYESRARAAEEPQAIETQGDLGLDQAEELPRSQDRRADEAEARMRRLRGDDDERARIAAAAATAQTATTTKDTRRELLPDIEEINSTLRTSSDGPRNPDLGQNADLRDKRARGFRIGFALMLLLAGAAVFVYSSHDSLSQSYPQAAPYIDSFMMSANGARVWLDDQVTQLFLKLNALTG